MTWHFANFSNCSGISNFDRFIFNYAKLSASRFEFPPDSTGAFMNSLQIGILIYMKILLIVIELV